MGPIILLVICAAVAIPVCYHLVADARELRAINELADRRARLRRIPSLVRGRGLMIGGY